MVKSFKVTLSLWSLSNSASYTTIIPNIYTSVRWWIRVRLAKMLKWLGYLKYRENADHSCSWLSFLPPSILANPCSRILLLICHPCDLCTSLHLSMMSSSVGQSTSDGRHWVFTNHHLHGVCATGMGSWQGCRTLEETKHFQEFPFRFFGFVFFFFFFFNWIKTMWFTTDPSSLIWYCRL